MRKQGCATEENVGDILSALQALIVCQGCQKQESHKSVLLAVSV